MFPLYVFHAFFHGLSQKILNYYNGFQPKNKASGRNVNFLAKTSTGFKNLLWGALFCGVSLYVMV